jgi:hypothetical protein
MFLQEMSHIFTDDVYIWFLLCWLLPIALIYFVVALVRSLRGLGYCLAGIVYSAGCAFTWLCDWFGYREWRGGKPDPSHIWPVIILLGWVVLSCGLLLASMLRPRKSHTGERVSAHGFPIEPLAAWELTERDRTALPQPSKSSATRRASRLAGEFTDGNKSH